MHRILARQINKAGIQPEDIQSNDKLKVLLDRIDSSYQQWDRDRGLLERSLLLTSEEMSSLYETLQRETAEEKIAAEAHNKLVYDLIDQANDATFIIDAKSGCLLEVNAIAANSLGYSQESLMGKSVVDISVLPSNFSWQAHVLNVIENGPQIFELTQLRKDGSSFPVEVSERHIAIGDKAYMLATVRDITERKQMEAKLALLAITDGLTNLYNRIHFNEKLENEVQRAIRFKTPLSLLMLDIDLFKKINDTYGHQAGDSCLIAIADLMKGISRTVDTCARYGGEEFVIILPQTPFENAVVFAERLRQEVNDMRVHYNDQDIQYTISIGVNALNRVEEKTAGAFLKSIDSALYEAKDRGRNCVVSGALTNPSI